QPIRPAVDEQGMKPECSRSAKIVETQRMNARDEPWPALKRQREEAGRLRGSAGRLAIALANAAQLSEPLGPAPRRMRQHAITPLPEREASIDRLLERNPHSGGLRTGNVKSDANTRVVFPPFVGVIVPASNLIASGSPCLLWST